MNLGLLQMMDCRHYESLKTDLQNEDVADYRTFIRMDPNMFLELVPRMAPQIDKETHFIGKPLILTTGKNSGRVYLLQIQGFSFNHPPSVVDANYKFLQGGEINGSCSYAQIFAECNTANMSYMK